MQKSTTQNTTAKAKQKDILPVSITPKLRLSKTEYAALETIAKVYYCTIEQAVATTVHRNIYTALEKAAPQSPVREKIMAEYDSVCDAAETLEKSQRDAKEIEVTVTMDLDKDKYEAFRRTFDAQSEREFFSNSMNGHLDEMNGDNPGLIREYLDAQNERLYGKKGGLRE